MARLDNLKKREMQNRIGEFIYIVKLQIEQYHKWQNAEEADMRCVWDWVKEMCEKDKRMKWAVEEMKATDEYFEASEGCDLK